MINSQENQKALQQFIAMASQLVAEYKISSSLHQLQENSVFALGAQLMSIGQNLTQLSGFKLDPSTTEGKVMLHEIVRLMEMKTIQVPEIIGQHLTEPLN